MTYQKYRVLAYGNAIPSLTCLPTDIHGKTPLHQATQLLDILSHLRDDLAYYSSSLGPCFSKWVDIQAIAAVAFHECMEEDVSIVLKAYAYENAISVDPFLFKLFTRLAEVHEEWARIDER